MTEILSQDDINSLLNAISSGEVNEDEYSSVGEQKKVKIYDFKTPNKFSKENKIVLNHILNRLNFLFQINFSAKTNIDVQITYSSLDILSYEDALRCCNHNSVTTIVNLNQEGDILLLLDNSLTLEIINTMSSGKPEDFKNKKLTDIELTIIETFIISLMGNIREAFSSVEDLRPRISCIEEDTKYVENLKNKYECCLFVVYHINFGKKNQYYMNLIIPHDSISFFIDKLTLEYLYKKPEERIEQKINLDNIKTRLYIGYDSVNISFDDLSKIKTGTFIPLLDDKLHVFV